MILFYLILGMQIISLLDINLTQLEHFIGYDASAVYLQAMLIWEQQTLLIEDWIYTSTLTWDTPMLLAVLLYGLWDDIFLAFGVSVLLSMALLIWIGNGLLNQLGASQKAKVIWCVCLLTPYVSYGDYYNRIDYFGVMLSIFGVYSLKTALMMAIWWMFFHLDRLGSGSLPLPDSVDTGGESSKQNSPKKGSKGKGEASVQQQGGQPSQKKKKKQKGTSPEGGAVTETAAAPPEEESKLGEDTAANTSHKKKKKGKSAQAKKESGDVVLSTAVAETVPKEEPVEDTVEKSKKSPWSQLTMPEVNPEKKIIVYLVLIFVSCFLSAVSSGYHVLLYGVIPPLTYAILRNALRNTWKMENILSLFFLGTLCHMSYWGKKIQVSILGTQSHETTLGWTTVEDFWQNMGSIFQGYLELTGALPVLESPSIMSPEGYFFGFFLVLSLGMLVTAVSSMIKHLKENKDGAEQYYAFVFFLTLGTFLFIYTTYGAAIFEVRYLIQNFIILLMFAAIWLAKELDSKNTSWRILLSLLVFPSLIMVNVISYDFLDQSKNAKNLKLEVIDYLADHESPVVYVAGLECITFGQNIRIFDREKTYLWSRSGEEFTYSGDYLHYTETSEYEGAVPLVMTASDFEKMPLQFQHLFQKKHEFSSFVTLYECKYNPIDYTVGITDLEYNKDYPYTAGLTLTEGGEMLENGAFRVYGTGAYAMRGPGLPVVEGIYDITLHYRVESAEYQEHIGLFDFVVTAEGESILGSQRLTFEDNSVTLKNVDFTKHPEGVYDYRLLVNGGTVLDIISVEMERVDDNTKK